MKLSRGTNGNNMTGMGKGRGAWWLGNMLNIQYIPLTKLKQVNKQNQDPTAGGEDVGTDGRLWGEGVIFLRVCGLWQVVAAPVDDPILIP